MNHSFLDDFSYVGPQSRIIYADIGKFCSIGSFCAIGMGTHSLAHLSTSSIFTSIKNGNRRTWAKQNMFNEFKRITIGNDVWIGQRVMVIGGVNIGNGAVVGAGAVVTKDVPPYAIVAGVPAKIIRYRFAEDVINKLEEAKWWELSEDILKKHIDIFQFPLDEDRLKQLSNLYDTI